MLVKVRTLVRHEHKAIRIQQRFSTFVPSTQADSSKFEQGRLAADSYVDYKSLYRGKAKMHIWRAIAKRVQEKFFRKTVS